MIRGPDRESRNCFHVECWLHGLPDLYTACYAIEVGKITERTTDDPGCKFRLRSSNEKLFSS
jgi:predicted transcriptional regulator YheO